MYMVYLNTHQMIKTYENKKLLLSFALFILHDQDNSSNTPTPQKGKKKSSSRVEVINYININI